MVREYLGVGGRNDIRWYWRGRLGTVCKGHCMFKTLEFILDETEGHYKILNRGVLYAELQFRKSLLYKYRR